jgi:uncharacterized Fe-S cluster-containing radical SAM superfamily protein
MYDPVKIAELTGKTVCENNQRKYYRFRPDGIPAEQI